MMKRVHDGPRADGLRPGFRCGGELRGLHIRTSRPSRWRRVGWICARCGRVDPNLLTGTREAVDTANQLRDEGLAGQDVPAVG